jgi:VanZ family protein
VNRLLPWAWLGGWAAAFVLTHLPIAPRETARIPHLDKVAHLAMYFSICLLGGLNLRRRGKASGKALLGWFGVYAAYGVVDEWTQSLVGRTADPLDWVFNVLGLALATAFLWVLVRPVRTLPGRP